MHSISLKIILICPINDNVNFDPLILVMSVRFLHCKIILFLFVIKEYFLGKYLETENILHLIKFSPTVFSAHWCFVA